MQTFQTIKLSILVFSFGLGILACSSESNDTTNNSDVQDTTQESNSGEVAEASTEDTEKPESIKDELYGDWAFNDGESMPLYISFRGDTAEIEMFGKYTYLVENAVIKFTPILESADDPRDGFEQKIIDFTFKDTLKLESADKSREEVYIRQ